jgi:hypothetical protein
MTEHYGVAMTSDVHQAAARHLLRADRQEDICFAVWYPSEGSSRMTALIRELVLPADGDRQVHGNASFLPQYFERAMGQAAAAGCGLALMHSHPGGRSWQGMSDDDYNAEDGHAAATKGATELPLVGLTLAGNGVWSARVWLKSAPRRYYPTSCSTVRVVGDQLVMSYNDDLVAPAKFNITMDRTLSVWGARRQGDLARLHVAVVGAGSVGAIVAEALARTGLRRITLIDYDAVEPHNLDRLLHATPRDARVKRPKVDVLARAIRLSATSSDFSVDAMQMSIVEPEGFRAALDADVIFSCVDRPWGRAALNLVAYAHLIPVIDGGIRAERHPSGDGMKRADWRAHMVAPGRRCLECLQQYDPGLVPVERDGLLDDPTYIANLPEDHELRRNQNVFAFSAADASLEVLQLLAATVAPSHADPGHQAYHFVQCGLLDSKREPCKSSCLYPSMTAKGDQCGINVTGPHAVAAAARSSWARQSLRNRIERIIDHLTYIVYCR